MEFELFFHDNEIKTNCVWIVSGKGATPPIPEVGEFVDLGVTTYAIAGRRFRYFEDKVIISLYVDMLEVNKHGEVV
jgi:hypothetical protein